MAGETLDTLTFLTKTVYEDPQDQVDKTTVLNTVLAKTVAKGLTGLTAQFPIRTAFSEATSYQPESGTLPNPGNIGGSIANLYPMYRYGTVQLTGPAAAQVNDGEGAYVDAMEDEITSMLTNMGLELNRVNFNDGSGAMGQVGSTGGAGPYTITLAAGSNVYVFRQNMKLSAASARTGGTARAGTMTVQAVDYNTGILTVDSLATGLAADDWLFNANSAANAASGGYLEAMGLLGIVDDGSYVNTLQGVNRSTTPIWKASVFGTLGASAALSLPLIRKAFSRSGAMGGKVDYLVSTPGVRDQYVGLIEPDRRYDPTEAIDGGFDAVAYTNAGRKVMWIVDKDAPRGVIFGIELAQLQRFEWKRLQWDEESGSIWKQGLGPSVGTYSDAYWAMVKAYENLGVRRCNSHFRIQGLTDDE